MRFPSGQFLIPARGARLKGVGLWKETKYGQVFVRPNKPAGPPKTPLQADTIDTLYWATQIAPLMDTYQQQFSRELSEVTQLAARDFLFIALFQRVGTFIEPTGVKWFSLASMQDVSLTLDSLGQFAGMLLFRGEQMWESLAIGNPGQVLQVDSEGFPFWADPPSGGGGGYVAAMSTAFFASTEAAATVGQVFQAAEALTITSLSAFINGSSAWRGRPVVALVHMSGSNAVVDAVGTGSAKGVNVPSLQGWTVLPLTAPFSVPAGALFYIGIQRTDGTGSTVNGTYWNGAGINAVPIPATFMSWGEKTSTTLNVGDTIDTLSGNTTVLCLGVAYGN